MCSLADTTICRRLPVAVEVLALSCKETFAEQQQQSLGQLGAGLVAVEPVAGVGVAVAAAAAGVAATVPAVAAAGEEPAAVLAAELAVEFAAVVVVVVLAGLWPVADLR